MSTPRFNVLLHHTVAWCKLPESGPYAILCSPRPRCPSSVPNPLAVASCGSQKRQPSLHHETRHSSMMCQLKNSKILCMFSSTLQNTNSPRKRRVPIDSPNWSKFVDLIVGNKPQNTNSANPRISCGHPSMRRPKRRRAWPEAVSPLADPNWDPALLRTFAQLHLATLRCTL